MLAELLDLIWPRPCETCGRATDRPARHVCSDCLNRLPFLPTDGLCRRCGRDAPGLDGEFLCTECRGAHRPRYDRAASALRFEGDARKMLLDFKFNRHLWLRNDFVDWLEAVVCARFRLDRIDALVPMPTTLWHRIDRGFNPSAMLTAALAKRLGLPCVWALRRKGRPKRQGGLSEEDRRKNVIDTFAVRARVSVRDATLLVVDDVMATGSTFSECARTLKDAGAKRVWCVSLVRSVRV